MYVYKATDKQAAAARVPFYTPVKWVPRLRLAAKMNNKYAMGQLPYDALAAADRGCGVAVAVVQSVVSLALTTPGLLSFSAAWRTDRAVATARVWSHALLAACSVACVKPPCLTAPHAHARAHAHAPDAGEIFSRILNGFMPRPGASVPPHLAAERI